MCVGEEVLPILTWSILSLSALLGILTVLSLETSSAFRAASTALRVLAIKLLSPGLLCCSSGTGNTAWLVIAVLVLTLSETTVHQSHLVFHVEVRLMLLSLLFPLTFKLCYSYQVELFVPCINFPLVL